jgi:hypothetical protein
VDGIKILSSTNLELTANLELNEKREKRCQTDRTKTTEYYSSATKA